jgi:hypothetical protein
MTDGNYKKKGKGGKKTERHLTMYRFYDKNN